MRCVRNLAVGGLGLAIVAAAPVAFAAHSTAYLAPPIPAKVLKIPAGSPISGQGITPTATVQFQSAYSAAAKDRLDGWVWKPAGASATTKVPLVVMAHGHTGPWSNGDVTKVGNQFRRTAEMLLANGIGVMLVDSFSVARNNYILARHKGDPNQAKWAVRPYGLSDDKAYRDAAVDDNLVRPYDLAGAATAVRTLVPWADPKKLVAVGYSHGGSAVLALSLSKYPLNVSKPKEGARLFRRLYATYPGCGLGGVNSVYARSAAVVPLMLGTGTADTETPPGPSPGQSGPAGDCRERFDQAVAAVAAAPLRPKLYVPTWLDYVGATHSWEIVGGVDNDAARTDWNRRLLAYVVGLK